MPQYKYRDGYRPSLKDPQVVGDRLQELRDKYGALTPGIVLKDAKAKKSILHGAFESEGFDKDEITQELNDWFDQTWEPDALQAAMESLGINPPGGGWDTLQNVEQLKEDFVNKMVDWMFDDRGRWSIWKQDGMPKK